MILSSYIFFVKKRLAKSRMNTYCVLVTMIALTLLLLSILFSMVFSSGRKAIYQCLTGDIDRYAISILDDSTFFNKNVGNEIFEEVLNTKEIEAFGMWDSVFIDIKKAVYNDSDYAETMRTIQNSNLKMLRDVMPNMFQGVLLPYSVFKYNNIVLEKGKIDDELGQQRIAILGHNFKDIPLGTIINVEPEFEYKVVGIIAEDQDIIDAASISMNFDGLDFDYTTNLNNMIVLVDMDDSERKISSSVNFVSFSDGVSYAEGKSILEAIFSKRGTKIKIGKLADRIDEVMSRTDWIVSRFNSSTVIFLILSIVTILTIQMMSFFIRKDEIGVWYSNGVGLRDIFKILFIENMFKIFVAFLLSGGIYFIVLKINNISEATMYYLRKELFIFCPLIVFLVCVFIALMGSLISLIYIIKKSIPDIINGNW